MNPKHDIAVKLDCALSGVTATGGTARLLHHEDLNACNTFDQPDRVVPRTHAVSAEGSRVRIELPPLAVATAVLRLA